MDKVGGGSGFRFQVSRFRVRKTKRSCVFRFDEDKRLAVARTASGGYFTPEHMQILIVRHGIAEELPAEVKGQDDATRELTKEGRRKMRKAARGLRQIVPIIDLIATSPLTRASQTADIVAREFEGARVVQTAALSPRKHPAALLDWLKAHPPQSTVALVGHEPHLGTVLCWLLTGLQESFVVLKKGAAAMVEMDNPVAAGRAKLLWLLEPSELRRLR
jgi:phosphohistidine phosphatase